MASELCSVETIGGRSAFTVRNLLARQSPRSGEEAFRMAREWSENNFFLGGINFLKAGYVNYGLRLQSADAAAQADFDEWLKENQAQRRMDAEKYITTAIDEFLMGDSLVSFWLEGMGYAYPLRLEDCDYTDALGNPILKVKMRHRPEDLKGGNFSKEEIKRYTSAEVVLDERFGEHYRVLTRAPRGRGFGMPRMKQVFLAASEAESMEVGESMLAYAARTVIRAHRLGWEIKKDAGVRQVDAMWDAERASAIEEEFQDANMFGVKNATMNFDHKIEHIWALDQIKLEGKRWETVVERMKWYGGPLAFMLLARNLNPDLLPMFMTEVQRLRADLRLHLQQVLTLSMNPPGGIKLSWGNRCFTNPKLFWDMLKSLMEQGPLPLRDALVAADVNPEEAAAQKLTEANDPQKEKKYLPLHEKFQGRKQPGQPGRTAGVKDGDGAPA